MNSMNIHAPENDHRHELPSVITTINSAAIRTDENWTDVNLNEEISEKERNG